SPAGGGAWWVRVARGGGGPPLRPRCPAAKDRSPPLRQGRRGHAELAGQAVQRLAAQPAKDRLRLPPRRESARLATAIGTRGGRRRAREGPTLFLPSAHGHLLEGASCPPLRCPAKL